MRQRRLHAFVTVNEIERGKSTALEAIEDTWAGLRGPSRHNTRGVRLRVPLSIPLSHSRRVGSRRAERATDDGDGDGLAGHRYSAPLCPEWVAGARARVEKARP